MVLPALVETHSLSKRYGAITSLRDCTVAVQPGEVFGLLGPNGAGKTTLLRLLLGLLRPSAGRATIDSLDCYQQSLAVRSRTGYLPGEVRLFRQMRGRQFLEFTSRLRRTASLARSLALAQRLDLDISRRVGSMSTGMRQKLALSAVLAVDVPLLILDEPTSNLDPTARREVLSLVVEAKRKGRTVLFSSHVLAEVEQVCDRVAILRAGELVHVQAMADLRRRHRIHGHMTGPMPHAPPMPVEQMTIETTEAGELDIETAGPLAPLLGWLATVPLDHVRIEPVGLAAVYERFHAPSEEALERHSA